MAENSKYQLHENLSNFLAYKKSEINDLAYSQLGVY